MWSQLTVLLLAYYVLDSEAKLGPLAFESALLSEGAPGAVLVTLTCDVVLHCQASSIEWYRNGVFMHNATDNPTRLQFTLSADTQGAYYCRVLDKLTDIWVESDPLTVAVMQRNPLCYTIPSRMACNQTTSVPLEKWYFNARTQFCVQVNSCENLSPDFFDDKATCEEICSTPIDRAIRYKIPIKEDLKTQKNDSEQSGPPSESYVGLVGNETKGISLTLEGFANETGEVRPLLAGSPENATDLEQPPFEDLNSTESIFMQFPSFLEFSTISADNQSSTVLSSTENTTMPFENVPFPDDLLRGNESSFSTEMFPVSDGYATTSGEILVANETSAANSTSVNNVTGEFNVAGEFNVSMEKANISLTMDITSNNMTYEESSTLSFTDTVADFGEFSGFNDNTTNQITWSSINQTENVTTSMLIGPFPDEAQTSTYSTLEPTPIPFEVFLNYTGFLPPDVYLAQQFNESVETSSATATTNVSSTIATIFSSTTSDRGGTRYRPRETSTATTFNATETTAKFSQFTVYPTSSSSPSTNTSSTQSSITLSIVMPFAQDLIRNTTTATSTMMTSRNVTSRAQGTTDTTRGTTSTPRYSGPRNRPPETTSTSAAPTDFVNADVQDKAHCCYTPPDVGPCTNLTARWYYSDTKGKCDRFWYGGCDGNTNNFETQEDCEALCLRGMVRRRFAPVQCTNNEEYRACGFCEPTCDSMGKDFVYCPPGCHSGCFCKDGFYRNRFGLCVAEDACGRTTCPDPNSEWEECGDPCQKCCFDFYRTVPCQSFCQPGCYCKAGYFFDQISGRCVTRSGCPIFSPSICSQPADSGRDCSDPVVLSSAQRARPQNGPLPMPTTEWAYNATQQQCQQFIHSGCGGNENRWATQLECLSKCGNICPDGLQMATCTSNPCDRAVCTNFPDATCMPDYCQGCTPTFYSATGAEIPISECYPPDISSKCDSVECGYCRKCQVIFGLPICTYNNDDSSCKNPCKPSPCGDCEECIPQPCKNADCSGYVCRQAAVCPVG